MSKSEEPDDVVLVDLDGAPEVFVEGYRGAIARAGVVKLNFFSNRFDPASNQVSKHAVVTLAVPIADLADIAKGLTDLVANLSSGERPNAEATAGKGEGS